jgi:hypothetical protein
MEFAKRSAVFAMRESTSDHVVDGLTAIAMIEKQRVDYRDILDCLSLLHHAASRSHYDVNALFRAAGQLGEPEVRDMVVGFTQQPVEYRDLRTSWGYDEVETESGLGFIGWGFGQYNPTVDLKSLAIDISSALPSEHYYPVIIEVAADTEVRSAGASNQARRLLAAAPGSARIHARLHPDQHAAPDSQIFIVMLHEMATESDVHAMERILEKKSTRSCKLIVSSGRLLSIIIAYSEVEGAGAYEDAESLSRFEHALKTILDRHAQPAK